MKKIVIAGANGFLGEELCQYFKKAGWLVVGLVRKQPSASQGTGIRYATWDGKTMGDWTEELEGANALVNLCGKSVNCRYTKRNREEIIRSRIETTRLLNLAVKETENPPAVWINASTATIYEHSLANPNTEAEGTIGKGFSVGVATAWEEEFLKENHTEVRKVAIRTSMVLGHGKNSVYPILARLTRFGLGGKLSSGDQMVSWIHIADFLRAIHFIIDEDDLEGAINITSPAPVRNEVFMSTFREALGMPFGLPHFRYLLEAAAFLMRTETELILKSRYVYPERLLRHRFIFKFPFIDEALRDLSGKVQDEKSDYGFCPSEG